jgi:hypothetical protein
MTTTRQIATRSARLAGAQPDIHITLWLVVVACALAAAVPAVAASSADAPLVVNRDSHVVVMEYEAWFGPNAVTFQGTAAQPLLESADMQAVGGGYDSADPAVIQQHVAWLETMGFDAALIETTNNVSCIFNSEWFIKKYLPSCTPEFRLQNRTIRNNTGNLYGAWSAMGTPMKLIPLMGGIDNDVLYPDQDGKTAFEKEIEYFGERMQAHPNLNVIYEGKPLILVFTGAAQNPDLAHRPLWYQIRVFLQRHPELEQKYTFKLMAGYLDSQPWLWKNPGTPTGPVEVDPKYDFWSWVDRLNTTCDGALCPYYPSFNQVGKRAENLTVSIATAGQNGWDCGTPAHHEYCADASLRYDKERHYATLSAFMTYARELQPIFLFVHQFNEYVAPDEGWNANTIDDVDATNLWGYSAMRAVKEEIKGYRGGIW